jgi:hypothetical protein
MPMSGERFDLTLLVRYEKEAMMTRMLLACMLLLVLSLPAMSESKGKGKAACESLKTATLCEGKQGCGWTQNPGGKDKCRTLKAEPR